MADVIPHQEALAEHQEAVAWYEARDPKVSERYRAAVNHVFAVLAENPRFYGWVDDEFREAPVLGFSYRVIYREVRPGVVQVVAISHTSRDPDYWRTRVPGGE